MIDRNKGRYKQYRQTEVQIGEVQNRQIEIKIDRTDLAGEIEIPQILFQIVRQIDLRGKERERRRKRERMKRGRKRNRKKRGKNRNRKKRGKERERKKRGRKRERQIKRKRQKERERKMERERKKQSENERERERERERESTICRQDHFLSIYYNISRSRKRKNVGVSKK